MVSVLKAVHLHSAVLVVHAHEALAVHALHSHFIALGLLDGPFGLLFSGVNILSADKVDKTLDKAQR